MTSTTPEALPLTPFGQTLHNLRQKIAHVIVTKVLQEEYDDLVEGYLDEILLAADDIIRLPAYSLVAQTYHDNLSAASAEPAARDGGEDAVQYEVWQDDMLVASSDILSDAQHFAMIYGQDGPLDVIVATTRRVIVATTYRVPLAAGGEK